MKWLTWGIFICVLSLIVIAVFTTIKVFSKPVQQEYSELVIDGKKTQVIIDNSTGCKYIVFNNKTLTPLYNANGQVDGCGTYE